MATVASRVNRRQMCSTVIIPTMEKRQRTVMSSEHCVLLNP